MVELGINNLNTQLSDLITNFLINIGLTPSGNVVKILIYILGLSLVYIAAIITQKATKIILIILSVLLGVMLLS